MAVSVSWFGPFLKGRLGEDSWKDIMARDDGLLALRLQKLIGTAAPFHAPSGPFTHTIVTACGRHFTRAAGTMML